jgi:DNA-binding GntR family transcriptional regulator
LKDVTRRRSNRPETGLNALSPLAEQVSLKQQVTEILRNTIAAGDLLPGSLHSVRELAQRLGVSRTPVREALIDLSSRGMVRFERNHGVRILQTTLHDLDEIFEIRLLLEVPASKRAVERLDEVGIRSLRSAFDSMERAATAGDEPRMWKWDRTFHHTLLTLSGNRRLADYVDSLRDMVLMRGATTTAGRARTLTQVVDEHRDILECIVKKDAAGAANALQAHIKHTAELLIIEGASSLRT